MARVARVTICRKWQVNSPIEAFCSTDEIGAKMELTDFISALVAQIGSPALMFSRAQLHSEIMKATDAILDEMKQTTRTVV